LHFIVLAAAWLAAAPCVARAQQAQNPPGSCREQLERWNALAAHEVRDWRWREAGDYRGEAPDLDDADWPAVERNTSWNAGTVWLRRAYVVPAQRGGYSFAGARLILRIQGSWAGTEFMTVFVNGQHRAQNKEIEAFALTERAAPGEKFVIAIRLQVHAGTLRAPTARVEMEPAARPDARTLLTECAAAEHLDEGVARGREARAAALEAARRGVDWAALERGNQQRFDASLLASRAALEPLRPWLAGLRVTAAGNSHIDMAWLWPWTETVEVTRNTFESVLRLMQEFPEFRFTHASVRTYAWMEEKYPELFAQIQRRVREGRWEVVGGMWVEPDLNMPDGESLARQLLIGKRYVRDRFGVDVKVGWNPDSFGYNWQLPQIYKKAGVDYFVTQKIYWNDTTRFPHKLFWWEAPDGSRLLTFFPHDYVNQLEPMRMARDLAATVKITGLPEMLHLYGIGDHGGGPTRNMLESGRRWQAPERLFPKLELGTALDFFERMKSRAGSLDLPVWRDELYLEYHRGVQTTQASTKKNNRRNEVLMLDAEKFSAIAAGFGRAISPGRAYPAEDLDEAWRKLLFNQFHDILPGSSIAPVYADAALEHQEVRRAIGPALEGALEEIAAQVDTRGKGQPVVVFNSLAWERTDIVEAEVEFPAPPAGRIEVRDAAGARVLSQAGELSGDRRRVRVRFLAEGVPPLGYRLFFVDAAGRGSAAKRAPQLLLRATADTLENHFLRVRVDSKTGCITSLAQKGSPEREALAPGACGNLLTAFRDQPKDWDAWNIDANFEDEKWDLAQAEGVTLVEKGPLCAAIRVEKKFRKSAFTQDITLCAGIPRVDVRTTADWREDHILIKAAFPVAAKSDFATFEIPYGAIRRPTTRNTPEEKAKFEVPAIRWADLSDSGGGLSVLNDCKYGYDAKGNVLRISLLRSPKWPDPRADMGRHEFTYSLYPHRGGWAEAGTVRRGYELNYPLRGVATSAHAPGAGALPAAHSFAAVDAENVALTALKRAEDGDAWVLRLYEFAGRESQARIRIPAGGARAWSASLLEEKQTELRVDGNTVVVPVKPHEIATIRVEWR
jgi:alpha-mannosidase